MPGKSHGQRSLVGCSPWGRDESDTTERLHIHFWLSCIGEGNGNPLQCCLENPRDGEAWWAAVYRVAQSRTRLKQLSNKQEMARVNFDILGIRELKWTRMGEFNSDDHYIYYCGQESLRRNGVAFIVNKESEMQCLDSISKATELSMFIFKANHSISW